MVNALSLVERLDVKRLLVWVVEFSLALSLVYSLLYLAGFFGISFFVLSNRSMAEYGVSSSLLSADLDFMVWGFSVFLVLAWLFYSLSLSKVRGLGWFLLVFVLCGLVVLAGFGLLGVLPLVWVSMLLGVLVFVFSRVFFGVSRFSLFKRLLFCFVLVVLFVEVAALVLVNVPVVLNLDAGFFGGAVHWGVVELSFSNLFYPFLPYAYLLFILLGVFAFVIRVLPPTWGSSKFRFERVVQFVSRLKAVFESCKRRECELLSGRFPLVLAVFVSVVVSCLFVVFTVLPWVNPTYMLVSVDSPSYYQWLVYMRGVDVNSALSFAFANDRAVFLVLSYVLSFVVSPLHVVQFVAALLISLFGVVSLLVLRLFSGIREVWVYGVFLVPFSFQALGLIYSGYFANMLALIFVLSYFVVFFRVLRCWSSLWVFVLLGLSVLVLFSHSWTWFVFALSLGAFLFLEWRSAVRESGLWGRFKLKATLVGATVGVGLVSDFVRKILSPISSSVSVLSTAQSSLGFPDGGFLLSGLRESVNFCLGGVFANQLLVFLSIVGFLFLISFRSEISNLIVCWVFVACVSILFASADFVFNRFLFLMPWVVLSSLGLSFVVRFVAYRSNGTKFWKRGVEFLVLVFVFLVLLNFALRYISNIVVW